MNAMTLIIPTSCCSCTVILCDLSLDALCDSQGNRNVKTGDDLCCILKFLLVYKYYSFCMYTYTLQYCNCFFLISLIYQIHTGTVLRTIFSTIQEGWNGLNMQRVWLSVKVPYNRYMLECHVINWLCSQMPSHIVNTTKCCTEPELTYRQLG